MRDEPRHSVLHPTTLPSVTSHPTPTTRLRRRNPVPSLHSGPGLRRVVSEKRTEGEATIRTAGTETQPAVTSLQSPPYSRFPWDRGVKGRGKRRYGAKTRTGMTKERRAWNRVRNGTDWRTFYALRSQPLHHFLSFSSFRFTSWLTGCRIRKA